MQPAWAGTASPDEIPAILKSATPRATLHGREALCIVSSPDLVCERVSPPSVGSSALRRLMAQKAVEIKPFTEPAVWSFFRVGRKPRDSAYFLIALPQSRFEILYRSCQSLGIQIRGVYTPLDALVMAIQGVVTKTRESSLIICETAGSVFSVASQADGEIVYARVFRGALALEQEHEEQNLPSGGAQRVARKINRSLEFLEKQRATPIQKVLLTGGAPESADKLAKLLGREVSDLGSHPNQESWCDFALLQKLSRNSTQNLTPAEARRQRLSQKILRNAAMVGLCFSIASLWHAISTERAIAEVNKAKESLLQDERDTQRERTAIETSIASMDASMDALNQARGVETNSAFYWLPGFLDRILPEDWTLTLFEAQPIGQDDAVRLRINGIPSHGVPIDETQLRSFQLGLYQKGFDIERAIVGPAEIEIPEEGGSRRTESGFTAVVDLARNQDPIE